MNTKLILAFLSTLYLRYIKGMERIGRGLVPHGEHKDHTVVSKSNETVANGLAANDGRATLYGNAYRGAGILIGILGAAIVFCALAPIGFHVSDSLGGTVFGILEVTFMVVVMTLLYGISSLGLKEKWIDSRLSAERLRYATLRQVVDAGALDQVSAELDSVLGVDSGSHGGNDQIHYNEKKHGAYHAMEHLAGRCTYLGFGFSFIAAIAHILTHHLHLDWLIFFTAFLPAAVGALHGINSFLRLEQLAEQHQMMAVALRASREQYALAKKAGDSRAILATGAAVYRLLTEGDGVWVKLAQKQDVKAP
jgi:hypothetical protein